MIDFDNMIKDISAVHISKNYLGLFSWLIDRAFCISPAQKQNQHKIKSRIKKRRSVLLKTLYIVNRKNFLECFSNDT